MSNNQLIKKYLIQLSEKNTYYKQKKVTYKSYII